MPPKHLRLTNAADATPPRVAAFRAALQQAIPCFPETARADLAAMRLSDLLHKAIEWSDRLLVPRHRAPSVWEGYFRHGHRDARWHDVLRLAQQSAEGADLTAYLSEDVMTYGYMRRQVGSDGRPRGINWKDKDYVLNAFGLHHLHLGAKLKANGFSVRSKQLLFAQFSRSDVTFLMLGDHKSFDDGTLAAAVAESRVGTNMEVKGILASQMPIAPRKRSFLNRRGISSLSQVGDKVVLMDMLSTAGTSIRHTRHADLILSTIEANDALLDDPATSKPWFANAGRPQPAVLDFHWMLSGCDLCAVENNSQVAFNLLQWCR